MDHFPRSYAAWRAIMLQYDAIIEGYRPIHQRLTQELTASYAPLFAEIPLAA